MVSFKGTASELEMEILGGIIEPDKPNIEFKNTIFDCESIKDAAGHIFINQTYCNESDKKEEKNDKFYWISCEDRMPKKENPYQRRGYYLTTNACGNVGLTRYEFEDDFQKTGWQSDICIVAWMPLPNPYNGEKKYNETNITNED
jgi:hypothetical protein